MLAQIFAPGGPDCSRETARACVADLYEAFHKAAPIVGEITGLEGEAKRATRVQAVVVDRPGWAYGASQSLKEMSARAAQRGCDMGKEALSSAAVAVGTTAMARMILGQFDPYYVDPYYAGTQPSPRRHRSDSERVAEDLSALDSRAADVPPANFPSADASSRSYGRLLLVAPNVCDFIQRYNLDQKDVCLWVCAHEFTHAVQYQAAPWLADFIVDHFAYILAHIDDDQVLESDSARRLMAVMSVLEGHAQYVMNAVGASHMPSKKRIIDAMGRKRHEGGALKKRIMKMFGFDQKAAQYRRGDAFVQAVIDKAGRDCLNRVWQSGYAMPTLQELDDPQAWIDRMAASCSSGRVSSSSGGAPVEIAVPAASAKDSLSAEDSRR